MHPNCTNCSNSTADVAFISIYALVFVVGLPLNIIALWIFFCRGAFRSITTVYMKNLATSDLLLLASLPLRVYYYIKKPPLPQTVCEVTGLLLLVNMYSSIFLLTCISWDRCMAVCFPLHFWAQALRKHAKYICICVWTLSILGTIPSYFVQRKGEKNDTLCFDSRPRYIMNPYVSSAMMLGFAVPLAVMVTCSCSLLRAVHQSMVVQMELVNVPKIQHMVVTNIAIFLGCFLPYHLVVICYQVPGLDEAHRDMDMVYRCALLLACVNATLDPLAYYFATETFRHLVSMDYLFQGLGTHTEDGRRTEHLAQSLRSEHQPTLPPGHKTGTCCRAKPAMM